MLSFTASAGFSIKSYLRGKKLNIRKYYLILASTAIILFSFKAFGQGTIINTTFYSKSLKMNRKVQIYLPREYNQQSTIKNPVIYFLHGCGGYGIYTGLFDIFNNPNIVSPLIFVLPDGGIGPWGGSYFTNSELYGNFEDYIVYDLVKFIDSSYNTYTSREGRTIMGNSMGSYGAMKLALKHPDIYSGVAAHSGLLDFKHLSDWIPRVLAENGGPPVSKYNPNVGEDKWATYLFYTMSGAFSPNLNNSPPVDFPLDSVGNWIDSTWNRWLLHDPVFLAKNINQSTDLSIFFDCGKNDEYLLYSFNTAFAEFLINLNIPYQFQAFNGGHIDLTYNSFSIDMKILDSVMTTKINSTGVEKEKTIPKDFALYQNYPNPFNPITTIKYSIPSVGTSFMKFVQLKVYDILGNEVVTLVNKENPTGNCKVEFNAS